MNLVRCNRNSTISSTDYDIGNSTHINPTNDVLGDQKPLKLKNQRDLNVVSNVSLAMYSLASKQLYPTGP